MRFPSAAVACQRLVEEPDIALGIDRQRGIDAIGDGAEIGGPGNAAVGRAPNVNSVRRVATGVIGPGDIDISAVVRVDRDRKMGTHPFLPEKIVVFPGYDDTCHDLARKVIARIH